MLPFTVIGVYESTGQMIAEHVTAKNATLAMSYVAENREDPSNLTIVAAIPGHVQAVAPCEDSGSVANAVDLVADSD